MKKRVAIVRLVLGEESEMCRCFHLRTKRWVLKSHAFLMNTKQKPCSCQIAPLLHPADTIDKNRSKLELTREDKNHHASYWKNYNLGHPSLKWNLTEKIWVEIKAFRLNYDWTLQIQLNWMCLKQSVKTNEVQSKQVWDNRKWVLDTKSPYLKSKVTNTFLFIVLVGAFHFEMTFTGGLLHNISNSIVFLHIGKTRFSIRTPPNFLTSSRKTYIKQILRVSMADNEKTECSCWRCFSALS